MRILLTLDYHGLMSYGTTEKCIKNDGLRVNNPLSHKLNAENHDFLNKLALRNGVSYKGLGRLMHYPVTLFFPRIFSHQAKPIPIGAKSPRNTNTSPIELRSAI